MPRGTYPYISCLNSTGRSLYFHNEATRSFRVDATAEPSLQQYSSLHALPSRTLAQYI